MSDDEVQFLQIRRWPRLQPRVVRVRGVLLLLELAFDLISHLGFALRKGVIQYFPFLFYECFPLRLCKLLNILDAVETCKPSVLGTPVCA